MTRIARLAVLFEGALALLAVALGWFLGVRPLEALAWTPGGAVLGVAATVPLVLGLVWSDRSRWPPLRRLRDEVDRTLRPLFAGCGLADVLLIGVAAGLGEELLFRGALQAGVGAATHPAVGVLVAAALFGLLHLVTPTYALLAGLVGLYLGWLFLATGSLLVPVVAHAAYDVVALQWWLRRRPASAVTTGPTDRPTD